MASPVKTYQKEMHDEIGFFATWLPGDRLELGEAGVFKKGRFRKEASLSELGIDFKASRPGSPQALQYTSASGTAITVSGGADVAKLAKAEIKIEFSVEGAFLFQAMGVRQVRIKDRMGLGREILAAYAEGSWRKDWWLVEALHVADCASVVISRDRSAALVVSASSAAPLGSLPLANPEAKLSIKSSRGEVFNLIAGRRLRPLFACLRVRDSFFGEPEVEAVRGIGDDLTVGFERPAIDELLAS